MDEIRAPGCSLTRRRPSRFNAVLLLLCLPTVFGCVEEWLGTSLPENAPYSPWGGSGGTGGSASGGGGSAGGGSTGGGSAGALMSGLPCEIAQPLAAHCVGCHSDPPGTLLTHADLAAPSVTDPSRSMAEEALARMRSTERDHMPPPPASPFTDAEIAAFQAWLDDGAPVGSCADPGAPVPDPYDTPVVCTSQAYWTGGDRESPSMHPGGACIACHEREDEGPTLAIAGTLYPTPHEPVDCNGVTNGAGATIVVTDADGQEHVLTPNAAGNFFLESEDFAFPYTAKIVAGGRERLMVAEQDDGDCNGCHTEEGKNRAPGRVFLP